MQKGDNKGKFSNNQFLPVTLKQLLGASASPSGDSIVIDNVEAAHVRFVAYTTESNTDGGTAMLSFSDGTSDDLKVSKFIETGDLYWAEAMNTLQ